MKANETEITNKFYSEFCTTNAVEYDNGRPAWRICFDAVYEHDSESFIESVGPQFGRQQDVDRAISVLERLGLTPQAVADMPFEEWEPIKRKMIEAMQW